MLKLRLGLTILALLTLAGCPGSSPSQTGGPGDSAAPGSQRGTNTAESEEKTRFSLYRVSFSGESGESESVSREARIETERLFASGAASPVWIVGGPDSSFVVQAAEVESGPQVRTYPLADTGKLLGGRRSYRLENSSPDRLELLSMAENPEESSVFYPVLRTSATGEGGEFRLGDGQVLTHAGRVVPAGEDRVLGLSSPPGDWGKFNINVDPETGEVWGEDERRSIDQNFRVFERIEGEWSSRGEFALTVVEPRTRPPEFTVSPFFLDGGRVIQLRSSPDAPLFDPRYRLFFRDLDRGSTVGSWLQNSTRLTWAARAGSESDYVLAVTPPMREPAVRATRADGEESNDGTTDLALFNTRTGGKVWSDELPSRTTRTGLSRIWRGSDWIMLGSWQRKEDSAAGYGKFYLIRTGSGEPAVELVNLASADLELLPPSNLSLDELYNGYRVVEGDPPNQRTTDDTVYFVQTGEEGGRRLLRLSFPEFEVTGTAELSSGEVVSVRTAGNAAYVLIRETVTPEPEPGATGSEGPREKLRENLSDS